MHGRYHHIFLCSLLSITIVFYLMTGVLSSEEIKEENLFKAFEWRNIGPANMGGRISDIQALDDDYRYAIVASASGGVWKTTNAGTTWEPIFDSYSSSSIGAVAIFQISHHNPHTLYYGANFLFKSIDRGESWRMISPDLTTNDPEKTLRESGGLTRDVTGAETHCTIVTISESPLVPGLIWAGTDEGNIQLTRDDGVTWSNVRSNLKDIPQGLWVSRVEASHFNQGTCYISFDGHRSDDFKPYLFKIKDFGQSWENITNNLPDGHCVHVLREDSKNKNLLFVGTEFAVFVSINGGKSWTRLMNGMPTIAVHDLKIHPRDGDLIAGTHGRSIWILDDITPLQQLEEVIQEADAFLFESPVATQWEAISRGATRGHQLFIGRNPLSMSQVPPENSPARIQNTATITYYIREKPKNKPLLEINDLKGIIKLEAELDDSPGIKRYRWNMHFAPDEEQRENFLKQMENIFRILRERVEHGRKQRLEQLYQEFKKAKTADAWNHIREQLMEEFWDLGTGMSFFGNPLEGPAAEPGTYRVILSVDDKTCTRFLFIRQDPLLNE